MAKVVSKAFPDATALRRRRAEMKRKYKRLYDDLEKLFYKHDPIGIGYVADEYDPEVELLLPRLTRIRDESQLADELHSVFVEMFDPQTAGPRTRYEPIARDVWRLVQKENQQIR